MANAPGSQESPQQIRQKLGTELLALTLQGAQIEKRIKEIKSILEQMFADNRITARDDMSVLFNDGTTKRVRLQRVSTGTYFKVGDDYKEDYARDSHGLQAKYLKAGKAKMAEKAHSWKVQEIKS